MVVTRLALTIMLLIPMISIAGLSETQWEQEAQRIRSSPGQDLTSIDVSLSADQLAELVDGHPDWQVQWRASVMLQHRLNPDASDTLLNLQPIALRSGDLTFGHPLLNEPNRGAWLLLRLQEETVPRVRHGLARSLGSLPDPPGHWLAGSIGIESDPDVRTLLVAALQRASGPDVTIALQQALSDPDAQVRAEAARVIGYRADGSTFIPELTRALSDPEASVRAFAARSLGWRRADSAWLPLTTLLRDENGRVRLEALRALQSIDRTSLIHRSELTALLRDSDPKVARLAQAIVAASSGR